MASAVLNSNGMSAHMGMVQFKEELRRLKREAIDDLSHKMDDLIGKADLAPALDVLHKVSKNVSTVKNRRRKGELPEKEFHMQNSVLTDLFQSKHIQTLENITVATLIVWVLVASATDALDTGNWRAMIPSSDLIAHTFQNYQTALSFWLLLITYAFLVYPVCYFWSRNRPRGPYNWFDRLFLGIYTAAMLYFLWLPSGILFLEPVLGPAAAVAVTIEQLRLLMKMHSFVREVSKQTFSFEESLSKKDDGDIIGVNIPIMPPFPGFSRYLYFLFAPTLIYRDAYPRNESINWNYVCSNFFQFFGCIVFMYYVVQRYLVPEFASYTFDSITISAVVRATFRCTVPGIVVLMLVFFSFLHSWLNAWAEMLRFGDRMFYKDWWNTMSYADYYRTWNCVVHDWLYVYIYKEMLENLKMRRKSLAALFVFATSACFHEYVIVSAFRFFYPVLLLEFGILGFVFFFFTTRGRFSNVLLWVTLIFGMGLMISLYSLEMSARVNCPKTFDDFTDIFVPRSWHCTSWDADSRFNFTD